MDYVAMRTVVIFTAADFLGNFEALTREILDLN
jgi:hypothetical protein